MKMLDFVWLEDQAVHTIDISLTLEQKVALEARHKKARDKHKGDRIKAVLLRSEGWLIAKIAQALRKSEASITQHIGDYAKRLKLKPAGGWLCQSFQYWANPVIGCTFVRNHLCAHPSNSGLHLKDVEDYLLSVWVKQMAPPKRL
jgi:hypothetical protein